MAVDLVRHARDGRSFDGHRLLLTRAGVMPGTTAIWGSAPGAASVMTFMSAEYGADMRLVALMQYLRVAMCVLLATIVARVMGTPTDATVMAVFPPAPWHVHLATLAATLLAGWIGVRFKMPGGAFLFPMLVAIAINYRGCFTWRCLDRCLRWPMGSSAA